MLLVRKQVADMSLYRYPADDIDKALSSALGKTVGKIRGVTPRNDLLNANITGQLNLKLD